MDTAAPFQIDFVIAGVQKAGTTALAQYLDQHDGLFLPPTKETHYFKRSLKPSGPPHRPIEHLTRHYVDAPDGALLGDATPIYLYWPHALELLHAHNPNLKIIVSLRHPVLRAWSAWSMEHRRGRERLPFSDAIRTGRQRVSKAPQGVDPIFSYVERGLYAPQIIRLLNLFDKDNVFFLCSDKIYSDSPTLMKLQSFLGVKPIEFTTIEANVNPSSLPPTAGLSADFEHLQALYQDDIIQTATLTNLNLDDWLSTPPVPTETATI